MGVDNAESIAKNVFGEQIYEMLILQKEQALLQKLNIKLKQKKAQKEK